MKLTLEINKARSGIYSDDLVFNCLTDLFYAFEKYSRKTVIPARYIDKQIAEAKRLEYLVKALVDSLRAIKLER